MGVFPEPARRADDVSRLVPQTLTGTGHFEDEAVAWLPRAGRETGRRSLRRTGLGRISGTLALGLVAGFGLPQAAFAPAYFAPAAQAHDRVDTSPRAAQALAQRASEPAVPAEAPAAKDAWNGLPVPEQEPATTALIQEDLAALPRVTQEQDAVKFGERSVPRKVVDTIVKASDEAGVDPVYMMALADKESSFDTDAKAATSSAQGLFQFVARTWLEMIRDYGARYGLAEEAAAVKGRGAAITVAGSMRARVLGLRNDPRVAALMAAELIKRDRERIEARVGRALTTTELYLAHFLGTASAGRFLSLSSEKPDEVAGREFRTAARANRSLFTEKTGGKRRSLTVSELHDRIDGMIDRRLTRYQGVAAVAEALDKAPVQSDVAAAEETAPVAGNRRVEVTEALPPDGV
ncbi:transglycosylase SLT domain-containing protein [Methylobacterium radiotolerans]|uniref:transglycosylase SLT domain-containing protein n=1 Tax=Methylobacterium TaxID=407 RepID=UPI0004677268|nr:MULTISPECIES: transglycosylase SLT domain-containing protein [Methylobacterium]KTS06033.1 lytic transglycosylase [Methylobacterium radiotolerans]KTS46764.1 lytic transglycosylase [Methylobacterium radiotolerans]MBN6820546.1 transglycosylase SLT domain-containing protein [Methylobacterium organophilum]MDE3744601.1 transglycosylase SLT domain-containing protein [Methylobacterium radiotolerans]ONF50435.1 lytic transglycosylase [Methylobacterium radiotolerans]